MFVRTMISMLGPGLLRDLTESKADLTRHGIVIIRMIETDIEPAIVTQARASISASPTRLSQMKEEELDRFMEGIRKAAMKSSSELMKLYTRLLATIGTDSVNDLAKELEGIGELFKWDRIAKAVDPVSEKLEEKGFAPIALSDPGEVSEAFAVELEQKWPAALVRFRNLVEEVSTELAAQAEREKSRLPVSKRKKTIIKR